MIENNFRTMIKSLNSISDAMDIDISSADEIFDSIEEINIS